MAPLVPVDQPLYLTKLDAAFRQTEHAIIAFEAGDYDVAITLAGAAEGLLPERADQALFSSLRDDPLALEKFGKKDWVSKLNADRDWLKHSNANMPEEIILTVQEASFMIARAISKLDPWSERMDAFVEWVSQPLT